MQRGMNNDRSGTNSRAAASWPPSLLFRQNALRRVAVLFIALAVLGVAAQTGQQPDPGKSISTSSAKVPSSSQPASTERGKQIAADSAKLLRLATDLKAEVDQTNKDVLSVRVVRTAGEIERLARNMKDKTRPAAETK
jgi:hypothetical protein